MSHFSHLEQRRALTNGQARNLRDTLSDDVEACRVLKLVEPEGDEVKVARNDVLRDLGAGSDGVSCSPAHSLGKRDARTFAASPKVGSLSKASYTACTMFSGTMRLSCCLPLSPQMNRSMVSPSASIARTVGASMRVRLEFTDPHRPRSVHSTTNKLCWPSRAAPSSPSLASSVGRSATELSKLCCEPRAETHQTGVSQYEDPG